MAVAINPNQRVSYVLDEDRSLPESERTEFVLRPITAGDFLAISKSPDGRPILADIAIVGICGWTNLRDEAGAQVAYSEEAKRARLLARWIPELASEVAKLSRLSRRDEKNSESPQPSSAAA